MGGAEAGDGSVAGLTDRHGRGYFAVQSAAGALWCLAVALLPAVRQATLGHLDPVLVAALDLPLFVAASALAALGRRWAVWVVVPWTVLVTAGMVGYATITGQAGWGALLMVAASVGSVAAGLLVIFRRLSGEWLLVGPFAFRPADPAPPRVHVRRTGAQMVVFWGLFLVLLPLGLAALERRWGLHLDVPAGVRLAGVVLLVLASALGVWSAWSMSHRGAGTPLPAVTARHLVVTGPYRLVRNPMAVAGITQAVAVGIVLGSWIVTIYALCGPIVWNTLIRPEEEADLEARFGAEFTAYQEAVPCWVPRLRLADHRTQRR